MKKKLVKLSKKPFVRNVVIVATGAAAAQAVAMAFTPVITRLYGPEAFGVLGVFMAIVGIIAPIAALSFPIAIVLPKSDADAKGLFRLSLYVAAVLAVFVAFILFFFHKPIVSLLQIEAVAPFLSLIPLVILFQGFLQAAEQWLIRTKKFGITAKVNFFQSLILQSSKVGFGLFYPVAAVLVILSTLGDALKALMLIIGAHRSQIKTVESNEPVSLKKLAKKHKDFPLYRAPQVFLDGISQSLPVLLLASFFGPAASGFFTICRRVLEMPTQLIGKSVGDVFYPRIAEAANSGENLTRLIIKATFSLGAVGIIPYGLIVVLGPWLFSFVFGAEWTTAGEYARWLAIWGFFKFLNQPSVRAMPVLSAQSFHLIFTIFTLSIRTVALAMGYYLFASDLMAIVLFAVSGSVLNLMLISITIQLSKKFDRLRMEKNIHLS